MEEAGNFVFRFSDTLPKPWRSLPFHSLQYVVVSSKKILFYNDEQDKEQSNPSMVLDIE